MFVILCLKLFVELYLDYMFAGYHYIAHDLEHMSLILGTLLQHGRSHNLMMNVVFTLSIDQLQRILYKNGLCLVYTFEDAEIDATIRHRHPHNLVYYFID